MSSKAHRAKRRAERALKHGVCAGTQLHLVATDAGSDFVITASAEDAKLATFTMTAYTGGAMNPLGFGTTPVVIDLSSTRSARDRIPILREHDTNRIVGHTEKVEVLAKSIKLAGVISGVGEDAAAVRTMAVNGYPWQASIGARPGRMEYVEAGKTIKVNGRTFSGPVYVARDVTLQEVSFVAIGADSSTSVNVAAKSSSKGMTNMTFDSWLHAKGFARETLTEEQSATLALAYEAEVKAAEPPAPQAEPQSPSLQAALEDARKELANEVKTLQALRALGDQYPGHEDVIAKAIDERWSVEKTKLAILEAAHEKLKASRPKAPGIPSGLDQNLTAAAIECAILASHGVKEEFLSRHYTAASIDAATSQGLRGVGLHYLLYDTIRAAGKHATPGRIDNDTIRTAFEADAMLRASGFSTTSLSGILGNVANKIALEAYAAVPTVVPDIAEEVDARDFKQFTSYRLTGDGQFERVGPDGELKHATLGEESYSNQVATRGRVLTLTREALINDDLAMFLKLPQWLGRMSALAREKAVFEALLAPGFFTAGNKNYIEGAATALSISSLTTLEQKFLDQTDANGLPIGVVPKVLLVPTSLKVTAEQIYKDTVVNETTTTDKAKPNSNPHAGKFKPVASPYLNAQNLVGSSSTAWYLFSDPAVLAALQVAYLQGRRQPTIESGDTDYRTLGMYWRGYFDFGVARQDYRAAAKSKGAA